MELVNVVKCNVQIIEGMLHYFTITAKDDAGVTNVYQALVLRVLSSDPAAEEGMETQVQLFKKKPCTDVAAGQGN